MTTNHPANGPVSLERLHQIREHLLHDTQYSNGGNRAYILADVLKVIDGAISAFGAEPVAWRYRYVHTPKTEEHGSPFTTEWKLCDSEDECNPSDCFERQPLFSAPPAPVSVPDAIDNAGGVCCEVSFAYGWNACRAAMLQTGNSPATPDGWIQVSERMPEGSEEVLCTKEFDGPGDWRKKVGYWNAGKWTVYGASWTPTHWMPLPAAPQQEVK
ncbi:DUF551 domain-containing protein [Citrobacter portucalensis]|uniref:DUF551 domain-containing protein n=1 Tax=Citrobacter portucalensis TaxID=1639133 RepID=UPI001F18E62F|nr:DUF551 domain-containing protein [Citrobacter portucalensis]MCE9894403.1 DUF551 domain-containing protein [Citrobacter portucalensis]